MGVVSTLYDALVSINVPDDKAKAVIDAMEREMMDKLATKSDLEHVRDILSKDIGATKADLSAFRGEMGSEFKLIRQEMSAMGESLSKDFQIRCATLENTLTLRLGVMMGAMFGVAVALVGVMQHFR